MQTQAHVVHQTRRRLRLRIPGKRKDLAYFLNLYEDLRKIPAVTDVVINPSTASVLLHFPGASASLVRESLEKTGLLPQNGGVLPNRPVRDRIQGVVPYHQSAATDVRTVLLIIMIGMAIHQAMHGKFLAPVLSALWYAYDLVAAHERENELLGADAKPSPAPSEQ